MEGFETGVYVALWLCGVWDAALTLTVHHSGQSLLCQKGVSWTVVGNRSVLHSRQWLVVERADGRVSSSSTSLPIGSVLARLFEDMQQMLVTVSTTRVL